MRTEVEDRFNQLLEVLEEYRQALREMAEADGAFSDEEE